MLYNPYLLAYNALMPFGKQQGRYTAIFLVLAAGIIITAPFSHYQNYIAQGDHGRDLYAAQAVWRGEIPYRDFWWDYGPLMPYYYGLFLKVLGVKISSVLIGEILLRLLGGVIIYAALSCFCSQAAAFLCSCWFMFFQQDFFYTYSHFGGIVMILGVAGCLLSYIQTNSVRAAWGALAFSFILCLIKINFGAAALIVAAITVAVADALAPSPKASRKSFYGLALLGIPLLSFLIYYPMIKGLSVPALHQCLPYTDRDQPYLITPLAAVILWAKSLLQIATSNWVNIALAVIINTSLLRVLYLLLAKNKLPADRKRTLLLSLGMLCFFYILNSHEFVKSGVWYRIFWAQPLSILLIFLLIDTATQSIHKNARHLIFLFMTAVLIMSWSSSVVRADSFKIAKHYLNLPRGGIYTANQPEWFSTVEQTTVFLEKTLRPHELFLALPYDDLYYYLTDRRSPTRQLIFFQYIRIPTEQEKSIIAELEKNHVNYILLSNRAFSHIEQGLGILGKDYCPLIARYIHDNFKDLARFGDWKDEPGWNLHHGTLILERKIPL